MMALYIYQVMAVPYIYIKVCIILVSPLIQMN